MTTVLETTRSRLTAGWRMLRQATPDLLAGLAGALASALVMLALRLTLGAPTLPELLGERLLPFLPVNLFIKLLLAFAPDSKTGPLGLALLSQTALGVLLGPLLARLAALPERVARVVPTRRALLAAGGLALGLEALLLVIFWPVLGESLAGWPIALARALTALSGLLTFAAYALATLGVALWLRREPATKPATTVDASRRSLFTRAGTLTLGYALGLIALDGLIGVYLKRSNLAYEGTPTPASAPLPITPANEFYVVSKNVLDPVVTVADWRLEVAGLVRAPRTWDYAGLRALPATERAITLECISNEVGARLMSTAVWRGVALADLLTAAGGGQPAGKYVIFTGVDGFQSSLPLSDLLAAKALLAWSMNGADLPARHGYPLRLLAPGRYGEQSAKWVTRIELVDQPFKGFYQSQGWSDAPVATTSRIDLPAGAVALGAVPVAGIAYGGTRGIQRVEVSADNGLTWHDAALDPPLSDQSWVIWHWTWTPATPGAYVLVVRATDGTGTTQTATPRGTVPDGATGWHRVRVSAHG